MLDAQALVGELVPEGSVFAFLAEHRRELFPDSFICDLFSSSTGRPSLPWLRIRSSYTEWPSWSRLAVSTAIEC